MENNKGDALKRADAYVQEMLQEVKNSAGPQGRMLIKPVIAKKHYPQFLTKPEVLVPLNFLKDVLEIIAGAIEAGQGERKISEIQKAFLETDTRE